MNRKIRWGIVIALSILLVMAGVAASAATYNWSALPKKSKLEMSSGFTDSLTFTGELPADLTVTSKKPKVCLVMQNNGQYTLIAQKAGTAKIVVQSKSQKVKMTLTVAVKANKFTTKTYVKVPGQVSFGIKSMSYDADGDLKCTVYVANGLNQTIYSFRDMALFLYDGRNPSVDIDEEGWGVVRIPSKGLKPNKVMFYDTSFFDVLDGSGQRFNLNAGHLKIRGTAEPVFTK